MKHKQKSQQDAGFFITGALCACNHRFNTSVQTALSTSSFICMNDAFASNGINLTLCCAKCSHSRSVIASSDYF
jgi:hypothetical protein